MTGQNDKRTIPYEERSRYWAEKIYETTAEIVAAFERASREDGVTQEEIAVRLDRHKSQVSKWLKGHRNLTVRTLSELALALECDLKVRLVPLKDIPQPNYRYDAELGGEMAVNTSTTRALSSDFRPSPASSSHAAELETA